MACTGASYFLRDFASDLRAEEVREWKNRPWDSEDEVFGRSLSWDWTIGGVDSSASVDLQETQLQLVVSERAEFACTDGRPGVEGESDVIFSALIQFEEQRIAVNGDVLLFSDASIRQVLDLFARVDGLGG